MLGARNLAPGTDYMGRTLLFGLMEPGTDRAWSYLDQALMVDKAERYAAWEFGGRDIIYSDVQPGQEGGLVMAFDLAEDVKRLVLLIAAKDGSSAQLYDLGDASQIPPYKPQ